MIRVNLTETQRQDLRRRARQEMGRVSERLHFVLLADQGHSSPESARMYGYNTVTVGYWLRRYLARGVSGLHDEPRSGAQPGNLGPGHEQVGWGTKGSPWERSTQPGAC